MLSLSATTKRVAGGMFARASLKSTSRTGAVRMLIANGSGAPSGDPFVFNVTHADFQERVVKSPVPVILDCYADWCGPCKILGPFIEAAVRRQNGKIVMAKLDTDANAEVASAMNITSLPTVYGIANGKMVEKFEGLQDVDYIDKFVLKMIAITEAGPRNSFKEALHTITNILNSKDVVTDAAMEFYGKLRDNDPTKKGKIITEDDKNILNHIRCYAHVGILRVMLNNDDKYEADRVKSQIEEQFPEFTNDPMVREAFVDLKKHIAISNPDPVSAIDTTADAISAAATSSPTETSNGEAEESKLVKGAEAQIDSKAESGLQVLENQVENNGRSPAAHYELAFALHAGAQNEGAVFHALTSLELDATYKENAARTLLFEIFDDLGPANDLTKTGRRKMTSILLR